MNTLWASCTKSALWASCIVLMLWASCTPVPAATFKKLTRAEPVVRMVLQESNGEPFYGMVAVAGTAFDRRQDDRWPNTLKAVIYQPWQYTGMRLRLRNYSIADIERARAAVRLAKAGIRPCGRLLWYHTTYIAPRWIAGVNLVCTIGNHIFYGDR